MNRRTLLLTLGIGCPAATVLGWGLSEWMLAGRQAEPPTRSSPFGHPIGSPFSLTDHTGRRVTDRDFAGGVRLVFFGFTHCPDVCPTALGYLSAAFEGLEPAEAGKVRALFISVDSARDSPELLAAYVANFHPAVVGLSGSEAEVEQAAKAFGTYYRKVPGDGDAYVMDHTASIYLLDGEGRLRGYLDSHEPVGAAVAKIRLALDGPPSA
ncbi:SCO family protein [Siccirubricoccus sp. KC 17139]|uniref:SCO family protein n=1 Tax=Siccirubricoccus soli TaxID=2899147 RepID=A0ABT1D3E6_9PROT|nr:SCO family protein [Siccirubricoccus soli]MCO6416132.1 SCO family protein [Siccirubricoccus soli]MCP2682266.1 SCO family protein [Siccirubricoccus soli]